MDVKIRRAIVSVSDKTGLDVLVKALDGHGVEIISTGGTAREIRSMGIKVTDVSDHTGFPEMMDGRVKTLHPAVHAGILADRDDTGHMEQVKAAGIPLIDMVVVDLYPFEKTVARPGVGLGEAVENIDIGGPTMLRAGAKNFKHVAVVSSPSQYGCVVSELASSGGSLSKGTLACLAADVFRLTSSYDGAIAGYLSKEFLESGACAAKDASSESLPRNIVIDLEKALDLRYGENPHQRGAFYVSKGEESGWIGARSLIQGKELSFNNILDLGSALEMVTCFDAPASVIVKHNNPCGAAAGNSPKEVFLGALDCDRMSAFGGIIGLNRPVDGELAGIIIEEAGFFECIIAPDYDAKALDVFAAKKNVRVVKYPSDSRASSVLPDIKKVRGGFLLQDEDAVDADTEDLTTVTRKVPDEKEMASLIFAWKIARFVKSNAIVLARGSATVGIGAGQMSRVDSVDVSVAKAGKRAEGAVMASDAFFPKADSIHKAGKAGITSVIQPGGSIRDKDIIEACDELGISMVFTARRHFRH